LKIIFMPTGGRLTSKFTTISVAPDVVERG